MNNRPGRRPGPRPPWPQMRAAAVITVMPAVALLPALSVVLIAVTAWPVHRAI